MNRNKNTDYEHLAAMCNFTKNAVKNFEENIVSQTNYLEKVDHNRKENNSKQ